MSRWPNLLRFWDLRPSQVRDQVIGKPAGARLKVLGFCVCGIAKEADPILERCEIHDILDDYREENQLPDRSTYTWTCPTFP